MLIRTQIVDCGHLPGQPLLSCRRLLRAWATTSDAPARGEGCRRGTEGCSCLRRMDRNAGRDGQRRDQGAGERLSAHAALHRRLARQERDSCSLSSIRGRSRQCSIRPRGQARPGQRRRQLQAEANQGKTQLDVNRYTPLAKAKAITEQDLDNAVQANLAAKAQVEAAKAGDRCRQGCRRDRASSIWASRTFVRRLTASRDWPQRRSAISSTPAATQLDDGFNRRSDQGLLHRHRAGVPALRRA